MLWHGADRSPEYKCFTTRKERLFITGFCNAARCSCTDSPESQRDMKRISPLFRPAVLFRWTVGPLASAAGAFCRGTPVGLRGKQWRCKNQKPSWSPNQRQASNFQVPHKARRPLRMGVATGGGGGMGDASPELKFWGDVPPSRNFVALPCHYVTQSPPVIT